MQEIGSVNESAQSQPQKNGKQIKPADAEQCILASSKPKILKRLHA